MVNKNHHAPMKCRCRSQMVCTKAPWINSYIIHKSLDWFPRTWQIHYICDGLNKTCYCCISGQGFVRSVWITQLQIRHKHEPRFRLGIYLIYTWLLIKIPLSWSGHYSRIKMLLSRNFRELHAYLLRNPCLATMQCLLWRFIHHLPNNAKSSRITSW